MMAADKIIGEPKSKTVKIIKSRKSSHKIPINPTIKMTILKTKLKKKKLNQRKMNKNQLKIKRAPKRKKLHRKFSKTFHRRFLSGIYPSLWTKKLFISFSEDMVI
jgi:sRNA-binding carbon storage regulator CsrA